MSSILVDALRDAGFEPPDNICAACHHPGGVHDLNNWCLVCPRPEVDEALGRAKPFRARSEAGWCFFNSMTDAERWAYGITHPAVQALLGDGERWRAAEALGHVVSFTETGYGLAHPPSCRPDLIGCDLNQWLAAADGPEMPPGDYRMEWGTDMTPIYTPRR